MVDGTVLIVSGLGILVSGVIGPMATARATRRANRQQFELDRAARRRDDLRTLVDEAAALLALGATNLRLEREASEAGDHPPATVTDWSSAVHLLRQRLLLRLTAENAVIVAYDAVQTALVEVGRAGNWAAHESAVERFETSRDSFLDAARVALGAPIGLAAA
jgi:hypothetical protein